MTENGWSTRGDETVEEGIADGARVLFLANYTSELRRAIYEVCSIQQLAFLQHQAPCRPCSVQPLLHGRPMLRTNPHHSLRF